MIISPTVHTVLAFLYTLDDDVFTAGTPETGRVSVKLVSGRTHIRRFYAQDTVRNLFAIVAEGVAQTDPTLALKPFDLVTLFPAKSLSTCLDSTLAEANLLEGRVVMRWLD